jgi:amino acid adenylation domain-containing protein/non-ribosomal peptide synthase protein (TIGR01720 family)
MTETEIAKRIADLPPEKRALLFQQLQKQKEKERPAEAPGIPRQERTAEHYPLSFAQQRLWFLYHFEPESPEYNIPQAFRIEGDLEPDVMQRALIELVRRHEALRTTFRSVEGEPAQVIAQVVDMEVPFLDVRPRVATPGDAWPEAMRLAAADAKEPFDLALGPLMRAKLYRSGEREWLLYTNVHHIAYDGWSIGIFARDLAAIYDALVAGVPPALPELPVQYLDFALWQRDWLKGEVLEEQISYWRKQLASVPPLEMPTDYPRPAVRTHNGSALPLNLGEALSRDLKAFVQREGSTLFIALTAAYKALLHHWTTQEDISVGTLIAGRRRPEVEGLIGFFANTLVLRTDLTGDPTFRELLAREREVSLDAHAHQDLPFEKLVEDLNPPRDLARTPLFQVMLILLNAPGEALEIPGLKLRPLPIDSRTSKMEMTLYLTDTAAGLDGFAEYNTDLFDRVTMVRLLGHYRRLLEAVVANPELRLSELPLLGDEERRQVTADWNATRAERPRTTLHGLIEAQVEKTPDAVAVDFEGAKLTYRELDQSANRLARHLRSVGVGPEVLVGVAMERSLEMLVGILGVLKAGGAYVPLDPEYPKERVAYMLEDSRIPVLLTQEKLLEKLPESAALAVAVDRDAAAIATQSSEPVASGLGLNGIAYMIYTSGSTGKPKGVQVPHEAVVNFLHSMSKKPGLTSADTLLAVTTLSFDIAGLELYLPLSVGARLLLVSRDTTQAGEKLKEILDTAGVTAMQATPATWRLLLSAGWLGSRDLKILCGGEAFPRDLANQLLGACGSLWNVYGPTEATIWSTLDQVTNDGPITIGKPLDNTEIYLLSRRGNPVPVGVPGELLIGGVQLARGYRGRPDLTADKFVPHPFAGDRQEPGARLYRTGDLARHLADGRIEFLGRIDHQVKVRGFRIELGDIEAALDLHPDLAQAVVVAREDTPGNKKLAAYLVTAPGIEKDKAPSVSDLRAWLKEKLPEYMIPALYTFLEAMPLTPNGKVDRRALPAPDKAAAAREYVAPRDEKEAFFCELWQEILGLPRVGINDDFFELGGDSLLVIRVVTKANKANMGITTKQVFQHRSVAELSAVAGTIQIVAEQGDVTGPLAFTPAELHFLEMDHPNPDFHSLGSLLEPKDGNLQVHLFKAALEAVLKHHDNLRVRIVEGEGGQLSPVIDPPGASPNLLRLDLSALPEDEKLPAMVRAARSLVISFKMSEGNLVRVVAFDFEPGKTKYFFMSVHFMAADVGSWQIMLDELDSGYRQLQAGEPASFQKKTTSAEQWAARLVARAQPGGMPQQERDYWLAQAPLNPPRFEVDHVKGPNDWISARVERVDLDLEESEIILTQVPRFLGVQIDAVLTTAILAGFEVLTKARALPILLLGHGREALYDDMDLTRTIGWFNTIYPVLLDMGPSDDLAANARELNRQLRRVPFGGTGYGILRYLSNDPDVVGRLGRSAPQPQVFFNYFGPDNAKELTRFNRLENFGGYTLDRNTKRMCEMTVGGYIIEDKLLLKWEYNVNLQKTETIQPAARRCGEVLRWFVDHYRAHGKKVS